MTNTNANPTSKPRSQFTADEALKVSDQYDYLRSPNAPCSGSIYHAMWALADEVRRLRECSSVETNGLDLAVARGDEVRQLRRIDQAARAFVDSLGDDLNRNARYRELCDALFDGRPVETKELSPSEAASFAKTLARSPRRLRDSDAAFNLGVLPTEQPEKASGECCPFRRIVEGTLKRCEKPKGHGDLHMVSRFGQGPYMWREESGEDTSHERAGVYRNGDPI